jgi:hypothetical protein
LSETARTTLGGRSRTCFQVHELCLHSIGWSITLTPSLTRIVSKLVIAISDLGDKATTSSSCTW